MIPYTSHVQIPAPPSQSHHPRLSLHLLVHRSWVSYTIILAGQKQLKISNFRWFWLLQCKIPSLVLLCLTLFPMFISSAHSTKKEYQVVTAYSSFSSTVLCPPLHGSGAGMGCLLTIQMPRLHPGAAESESAGGPGDLHYDQAFQLRCPLTKAENHCPAGNVFSVYLHWSLNIPQGSYL